MAFSERTGLSEPLFDPTAVSIETAEFVVGTVERWRLTGCPTV
jgi:hypothetical protein